MTPPRISCSSARSHEAGPEGAGQGGPARMPHQVGGRHVRGGTGHFSVLCSFPPEMQQPYFAPAQDPTGFDRAAFQRYVAEETMTFMRETPQAE